LVVDRPIGFWGDYSFDLRSLLKVMPENSIFGIIDFHWLLANQWDFEVNREHIRVPHFETHVTHHFLKNSIFIGFRLTNHVSHDMELIFGFSMLDYLLSMVPGAKIRLSRGIHISNESGARDYTYFRS
jgi:hypothetical protein